MSNATPPELPDETRQFAAYIAMAVRNAMEDFHCEHLSDEQFKPSQRDTSRHNTVIPRFGGCWRWSDPTDPLASRRASAILIEIPNSRKKGPP